LTSGLPAGSYSGNISGRQWESSQVRDVAPQAVLIVIRALAMRVALVVEAEAARSILARSAHVGWRRPRHARNSCFRLARDRLWQRLWQDDTTPLTWELAHLDAPNRSQECWHSARSASAPVSITGRVCTSICGGPRTMTP